MGGTKQGSLTRSHKEIQDGCNEQKRELPGRWERKKGGYLGEGTRLKLCLRPTIESYG
jgi:hypothetical protein